MTHYQASSWHTNTFQFFLMIPWILDFLNNSYTNFFGDFVQYFRRTPSKKLIGFYEGIRLIFFQTYFIYKIIQDFLNVQEFLVDVFQKFALTFYKILLQGFFLWRNLDWCLKVKFLLDIWNDFFRKSSNNFLEKNL